MNEELKYKELSAEELEKVSGGAGMKAPAKAVKDAGIDRMSEFEAAWNASGYPAAGATRHQLEAMYDEWEANGFKPSAAEFLIAKKAK